MPSNPVLDPMLNDLLAEVLQRNSDRPLAEASAQRLDETVFIEHLISSTLSVFRKMCGIEVTMLGVPHPGCAIKHFEISGFVGIVGPAQATLAINLPPQFAFKVVEKLTGCCPSTVDADVIDAVGEMANMIAGKTKERLGDQGLTLGLPTVIVGPGHRITFGANMRIHLLRFNSDEGPFQIELGIDIPRC